MNSGNVLCKVCLTHKGFNTYVTFECTSIMNTFDVSFQITCICKRFVTVNAVVIFTCHVWLKMTTEWKYWWELLPALDTFQRPFMCSLMLLQEDQFLKQLSTFIAQEIPLPVLLGDVLVQGCLLCIFCRTFFTLIRFLSSMSSCMLPENLFAAKLLVTHGTWIHTILYVFTVCFGFWCIVALPTSWAEFWKKKFNEC